jgi:cytochrome bd ubiquinol oxidase subunit II
LAVAFAIAGLGLLNIADADWAHAVGVSCLIGFVVLGFVAVVVRALDERGVRP